MHSPPPRCGLTIIIAVVVMVQATPLLVHAGCIEIALPKVARAPRAGADATLIFSGTVGASDAQAQTVSFTVDRVWKGDLRRETTLFIVPATAGPRAESFQAGAWYLVLAASPPTTVGQDDATAASLLAGTVRVLFGCVGGAMSRADASEWLERLGRGKVPRP